MSKQPARALGYVKLWQFNLATFAVTQLLYGVEGWISWAIPASIAWLTTRNQAEGQKDYRLSGAIWIGVMIALHQGRA